MIGIFIAPTIATMLKIWSVVCNVLNDVLRASKPIYCINKIKVEVILASHTQYVPQVGFPEIAPEISTIKVKTKPKLIVDLSMIADIFVFHTR